ncbi:MAG: hypothetical protein ABEI57_00585 [Halapricum sp.]
MFDKLGIVGLVGVLIALGGIGLVAWQNLMVAAGLAFVLAGIGLIAFALVRNTLSSLGMGAMP